MRRDRPRPNRRAIQAVRALQLQIRPVERRFVGELGTIVRGFHKAFMNYLGPAMEHAIASAPRADAGHIHASTGNASRDVDVLVEHLVPQLGPKVAKAHSTMVDELTRVQKRTLGTIFPIDFAKQPAEVQYAISRARSASIGLIEDAGRAYAQQVRDVFADPELTVGVRVETLRDALLERGSVSESRASLIARDQTLKLNGFLNRAHQLANGVSSYTWSTSGDERVRDSHSELDTEEFSWDSPPVIDRDDGSSEPLNPGEDYQCRCIAIPIIAELEGI